MATAAPGELNASTPVPSSGSMRVQRAARGGAADGAAVAPASATSTPSLQAASAARRLRPWLFGIAVVAAVVAALVLPAIPKPTAPVAPVAPMAELKTTTTNKPVAKAPAPAPVAQRPGVLIVQVEPSDARVVLDGRTLDVIDGLVRVEVDADTPHVVLIEAARHQSMQFDVDIGAGETMKVPVRLPVGTGKGELSAPPAGSRRSPPVAGSPADAATVEPTPALTPPSAPAETAPPVEPTTPDARPPARKGDKNYTIDPF
jgi:hypothetical protein